MPSTGCPTGDLLYPLRGPGLYSRPIRVTIRSSWKLSGSFWRTRYVPRFALRRARRS